MARDRLLIVGARGFLGANLAMASRHDYQVIAHSSTTPIAVDDIESVVVDLEPAGAAVELVGRVGADLVVNCAALADVDRCERDPTLAARLNAEVPGELAAACRQAGAGFIHISTDAVFGSGSPPFLTTSTPSPVNAYGRSKLDGEQQVLAAMPGALVARTNIVGWSPTGRRSLLEFFHTRLSRGERVAGFTDVVFRPVAASDLWPLLHRLSTDGTRGIWHATGCDLISKFDFGVLVASTFGWPVELVEPTSVAGAGLAAARSGELDVIPSDVDDPTLALGIIGGLSRLASLEAAGYRNQLATFIDQEATTSWTS